MLKRRKGHFRPIACFFGGSDRRGGRLRGRREWVRESLRTGGCADVVLRSAQGRRCLRLGEPVEQAFPFRRIARRRRLGVFSYRAQLQRFAPRWAEAGIRAAAKRFFSSCACFFFRMFHYRPIVSQCNNRCVNNWPCRDRPTDDSYGRPNIQRRRGPREFQPSA